MLAIKLLIRNWRSGELRLLSIALLVAITVVSGVSVFSERLETSLQLQTAELLGADAVVISSTIHPEAWKSEASRRQIKHVDFIRTQTMAYVGDDASLISLQVVSQGYPLRGQIETSNLVSAADNQHQSTSKNAIPKPGEIWAARDLFLQLDIELGQKLEVGNVALQVTKVLTEFPEPFSRYPVVMMHRDDLAATGIVQPGAHVRYRWLLASDDKEVLAEFKKWLQPRLDPQQEISDGHSRSEWLERTIKQSTNLLSFSAVISVLLAGVAISIATRQFVERHIAQVAIKKSFGATSWQIRKLYFGQLLFLGITASLIAVTLGYWMQEAISNYMLQFFDIKLASASLVPLFHSLLAGIGFLLFFALPPLWHLPDTPPIRVLRSDMEVAGTKTWLQVIFVVIAMFSLIALFSDDIELTLKVCGALVVVVALTLVLARMTLWVSKKWATKTTGYLRLGLVNLQRRHKHNTLLVAVFSTAMMALLTLTMMRNSFWQDLQEYASAEDTNTFVMNISKEQKPILEDFLVTRDIEFDNIFPTIVARLTQINGEPPPEDKKDYWAFSREVWMSWQQKLTEQEALLEGQWWPDIPQTEDGIANLSIHEVAVEEGGLALGDVITFSIAGEIQKGRVTSVRKDKQGEGLDFLFLFQPDQVQHHHHIYHLGLNVPPEYKRDLYQFGRDNPTMVIESFDVWIEKTQKILTQALDGALFVLLLILFCGCLVLFAAVNSSIASRKQESGLLRAFGSSQRLILGSVWVEFLTIGAISGVIAVIANEVLFYQVQNMITEVPLILHFSYWTPVILGSGLFVGMLGVLTCRSTVQTPPSVVLRDAA